MLRRVICLAAALSLCLSACGQPERVGVAPQPIIDTSEEIDQSSSTTPESTVISTPQKESTSPAEAGTSSARTAPPPASPESTTATAGPGPGECLPQYAVVAETSARDTRAGNLIGRVHPGAHVGVKQSDGVWAYGYVSAIDGRGAGWAWMLHEKMRRIGGSCG
ncbi:hypothetical protein [Amycolatopsis mediterranei]|uniref:hypothetical protein n=1 Tax=Amycolatopsis mediterranei TaxID=33910 RepID=UPI00114CDEC7|nr:hypothetical protein [Amycolatopsis mediterranei]UZF74873.1 hypothetical protein ISP_008420 [Amycolatopsis mediterranei]